MAKTAIRLQVVASGVFLALLLLVGRAAQVQLLEGRRWAEEARAQRTERTTLAARRGTLFDRHGTALALTQETYHVGIAPNEVRDPAKDGALISRQLGLSGRAWPQALRKRYAYFAGPFSALQVRPLRRVRGVHLEPVLNRFYPAPEFARAAIGRVGDDGRGASGLERTLDSLLAGRSGAAVVLKDRAGREYESPARVIAQPVPGHDVVLTLDAELQEIAQRALDDALRRMDADGGDVVLLDPATGEVLAIASRQRDGPPRPSAFTDTFEPGSVAKIFAAAALLSHKRVRTAERVSGEGGTYRLPDRTITDDDPQPSLTLADAIRVSSNIAIVKFAARLRPADQYGMLRDFGFGAPTGIEFPAEAGGKLRSPSDWTRPSAASLAMGYELSVTPIQVAVAYAALANDGLLLQPTLIKEVRSPAGELLYRHRPEPVRRAVSREIAAALRDLLRGVVERGTGAEAALTNFSVAAKTGTARRVVNGRYAPGQYTASFAALFPADQPQLVLVVKIDNPHKGSYFAAQTAAPVTRSMLEQALAARTVALDRARLSTAAPPAEARPVVDDGGVVPFVVPWPYQPDSVIVARRRSVPDVAGLGLREAVRALHRRGFRVTLKGWGAVEHTWPAGGDSAAAGATVTVFASPWAAPPASPARPASPPARQRPRRGVGSPRSSRRSSERTSSSKRRSCVSGPRSPGLPRTAARSSPAWCTARCGARCKMGTHSSARRGSAAPRRRSSSGKSGPTSRRCWCATVGARPPSRRRRGIGNPRRSSISSASRARTARRLRSRWPGTSSPPSSRWGRSARSGPATRRGSRCRARRATSRRPARSTCRRRSRRWWRAARAAPRWKSRRTAWTRDAWTGSCSGPRSSPT
jgi:cell division protein FtsI (penicillin-binding protein 3)